MTNGIIKIIERKGDIAQATPTRFAVVQRAAAQLSRRNADAAVVEVFAESMQRLTLLAYEQDDSGHFCNIDPVTWRILVPMPFGKLGHRRWGITASESVVLREMIQRRQLGRDGRPPGLFLFDTSRRAWRLNLFDFDTPADGHKYWQKWPLTVAEYRTARSARLDGQP